MSLKHWKFRDENGNPSTTVGVIVIIAFFVFCFTSLYLSGGMSGIILGLALGLLGGIVPIVGLSIFGDAKTKAELKHDLGAPKRAWKQYKQSKFTDS